MVHAMLPEDKCLQLKGVMLKNAKVDQEIADKIAAKGGHLVEGGCKADGFTKDAWNKFYDGIGVSVWVK